MSAWDKLKHAVVEEDPPSNNNVQPAPVPLRPIPFITGMTTGPAIAPSNIQTPDNLRVKVAGAGSATVFAATLKSLVSYIPDEASRFKAAKDMLASQGVTVAAIAADMGSILGRLDAECKNFESAKTLKQSTDVSTKEARLAEIDTQMNQLKAERDSVAVALVTAKNLIEKKEQEFYASANALKTEYNDSLAKIKTYLGASV